MIIVKCTIKTKQFIGNGDFYYHIQEGVFNYITKKFTPNERTNGNHPVWFKSIKDFHKAIQK